MKEYENPCDPPRIKAGMPLAKKIIPEKVDAIAVKYEVECDKCDGKAALLNVGDFGYLGRRMIRYRCKKCYKIMYKWI